MRKRLDLTQTPLIWGNPRKSHTRLTGLTKKETKSEMVKTPEKADTMNG